MATDDVCRLCLATEELVYIFNEENKKLKMKDIISITTGIEIHTKDMISQKICRRCYQFCIQILQFRGQCLQSDKYLKGMRIEYLADKKYYIPNTDVSVTSVKNEEESKPKPLFTTPLSIYKIHPSMVKLSRIYPKMKLPKICLNMDVEPIVLMEIDHVENYFKKMKLNFNLCVKNAFSSAKESENSTKFSRIQNSFKQKRMLALPKGVRKDKEDSLHKGTASVTETTNNMQEVCRSSNKSLLKESNSKSNVKRKLTERPNAQTKVERSYGTDTDSTTPSKRSKFISGKKSSQDDQSNSNAPKKRKLTFDETPREKVDEKTILKATKRRKVSMTEYCSNKKIDDVGAIPNKVIPKKIQFNNKKPVEELTKTIISDKSGLKSPTKNSGITFNRKETQQNEHDEYESLTSMGKSVPLLVCEICNSVHYHISELKKHQNKHMRCQFCKIYFRSLENKNYHIENVCMIRKMMDNLPIISLERIESNNITRQSYPEAFLGFSPLVLKESLIEREKHLNSISVKKALFKDFPLERLEIIEILSDDETLPISSKEQAPIVPNISSNIFDNMNLKFSKNGTLKELLTMFHSSPKEVETQTHLSHKNYNIVNEPNKAVLKDLLSYMLMYSIPVNIQPGKFNVTYDYNLKSNLNKKMDLWNELTPIDIQSGDFTAKIIDEAPTKRVQDV